MPPLKTGSVTSPDTCDPVDYVPIGIPHGEPLDFEPSGSPWFDKLPFVNDRVDLITFIENGGQIHVCNEEFAMNEGKILTLSLSKTGGGGNGGGEPVLRRDKIQIIASVSLSGIDIGFLIANEETFSPPIDIGLLGNIITAGSISGSWPPLSPDFPGGGSWTASWGPGGAVLSGTFPAQVGSGTFNISSGFVDSPAMNIPGTMPVHVLQVSITINFITVP